MSTALRIASVTHVLKDLLNNGLIDNDLTGAIGGNVTVTSLPPDKIDVTAEASQLNIFMYQTTPNQGWRNVGLPSFNGKGERISNPPLAVDLHYLLSAYGAAELHTDILLGYGMQLLHETPVLEREAIRRSLTATNVNGTLPASLKLLSTSDLAEQVEMIKITPETLSLEDISKLWAAFGTKYRPTASYKATVVLIESSKSTKPSLPVKERNIYVVPIEVPIIESLLSQSDEDQPEVEDQIILNGYRLILIGKHFKNDIVLVKIDSDEITIPASDINDSRIAFNLPDELRAGIHEVQLVHPRLMGTPLQAHKGVSSRTKTFILSPEITDDPEVTDLSGSGDELRSATIKLEVSPPVYQGQRVTLLMNEIAPNGPLQSYSFSMPVSEPLDPPDKSENISIKISGVKQGNYLARIQVDDGVSPLTSVNDVYTSPIIPLP